jgi:DUF4097 and DUF4098 domain-containing protein YvlB
MPVAYTLTVPRTARLRIDDHESEVDIEGIAAELTIDTHEGPIAVRQHEGRLMIDSHESRIDLTDVRGDVEIDTHEGTVTARGLRGGLRFDNHDANGDIAFAALEGDVTIDTHDGSFTLTMPTGTGFGLRTDFSDDASLQGDLDLGALRIGSADDGDDEVNYDGDVNGGGPLVSLSAHDGSFRIRMQ